MEVLLIWFFVLFSIASFIALIHFANKFLEIVREAKIAELREYEAPSSYETMKAEREAEFDARIEQMKEELALQQVVLEKTGTIADEPHPLVHNLPHNTISTKRVPDVEYAE